MAGPLIRIVPPGAQSMVSEPPGSRTSTGLSTSRGRIAATAVAQAPVPQAEVRPAPRSQTRRRIASLLERGDVDVDPLGEERVVLDQRPEPRRDRPRRRRATKKTTCGLPTLTAAGSCSSSQPTGMRAVSIA